VIGVTALSRPVLHNHIMEPFRFHLYVCTQEKPAGVPSCPAAGAAALLSALEKEVIAQGLDDDVHITTSGCMGLCEESPTLVVYPEGVWYRKVQPSDAAEIVAAHLKGGRPVERLVWRDANTMKAMSAEHRAKYRAMVAAREAAARV